MKQQPEQKLNKENFYSFMKLDRFGFGLKATGFVSFLAWTGIVISVLVILFSVELLIVPTDVIAHIQSDSDWSQYESDFSSLFYIGGVLGLLGSAIWLALHLVLRKRNVKKDFQGIRNILKIKCFIYGSFQIIISILGITACILLRPPYSTAWSVFISLIPGLAYLLLLIFSSCMVHGVRKENNKFIKSYIIFKIVGLALYVAFGISCLVAIAYNFPLDYFGTLCVVYILVLLITGFFFIYSMGDLVVLYNINHNLKSEMGYGNLALTNQTFVDRC